MLTDWFWRVVRGPQQQFPELFVPRQQQQQITVTIMMMTTAPAPAPRAIAKMLTDKAALEMAKHEVALPPTTPEEQKELFPLASTLQLTNVGRDRSANRRPNGLVFIPKK
jgi:cytochrome c553